MAKRTRRVEQAPDDTAEGRKELQAETVQQLADAVEVEEAGEQVERTPDGGAIITKFPGKKRRKVEHFSNLAIDGDDDLLDRLDQFCRDLYEDIQLDIESATKSEQKYADAIGATGLTGKAPGGAPFPGASTVTHPILGEVCSDYSARVCREMLPPGGAAKPYVEGVLTKEKFERAKRVARHMNWQMRRQMRNFAAEMEQTFTQQPFAGAGYMKLWGEGKKPRCAFIPQDKVHRPPSDDDFYSCERITHEQDVSMRKIKMRMRRGMYAEIDLSSTVEPDRNKVQVQSDKTIGVAPTIENVDKTRRIYETSCFTDIESEDGIEKPYIVTMDAETREPLALFRNWEEEDEQFERLDFLYEFGFWPFRDGKPIGLSHMLSGLPRATTGALRALMDAALANVIPGGAKLKSGQSGQTVMPGLGQYDEIENATQTDDIRKLLLPNNLNPVSPVLFQLLGFLVDAGKGMVRTTFDDIVGKGRQDIPVGTMMMLVDEGTVVYSSIFARQHRTMGRLLEGLYRLNQQLVENEKFTDTDGSERITKHDYKGPPAVAPVSDPRINSDTQRFTRANFLAGRAKEAPMVYKPYEVEKYLLEACSIDVADLVLVKPMMPTEMSAPNENVAIGLGRPVAAFPEQNHLAHLESHIDFVKSPIYGANPAFQPTVVPAMLQHIKEHMTLAYAAETMKLIDEHLEKVVMGTEVDVAGLLAEFQDADTMEQKLTVVDMLRVKDAHLGRMIDKMFAAASAQVVATMAKNFEGIMPLLTQLNQQAQQFKPPMPMDPTQAGLQVAQLTTTTQKEVAGMRTQVEQAKLQQQGQKDQATLAQAAQESQADIALRTRELDQKDVVDRAEVAAKQDATDQRHQMNTEDNQTALTIAAAEIASGDERVGVSTGTGINPGT